MLGGQGFSQRIDPMLLQEIFQTPFSNNNKKKKINLKAYRPVARQKHTPYVDSRRIFKRKVPVDYSYQSRKKHQEPFLLLV